MLPPASCSNLSCSEGNAWDGAERELLRLRGDIAAPAREAPDDHGGDAAGVADKTDQATLQRLLSLTPNLKLIVRDVTHASRRSPRPLTNTSTN